MARRGVSGRPRDTCAAPSPNRFLKVMYQLCVRVKTGAAEVMEIVVPLVIGTVPCEEVQRKALQREIELAELMGTASANSTSRGDSGDSLMEGGGKSYLGVHQHLAKNVLYLHCRLERYTPLVQPGETYHCPRSQLNHTNKYPIFVGLPTSSKSSRKVSMMANMFSAREENSSSYVPSRASARKAQQSQELQKGRQAELREEVSGELEVIERVLDGGSGETDDVAKAIDAFCNGDGQGKGDGAPIVKLSTGHRHSFQQTHIHVTKQLAGTKQSPWQVELDTTRPFMVEVESIGIVRSRALQQHRGSRGPLPAVELPMGGGDDPSHLRKQPSAQLETRRSSANSASR